MQLDFTGTGWGQLVQQIVTPNGIEGGVKELLSPTFKISAKPLSRKPPK